jgi:hypothetical protein
MQNAECRMQNKENAVGILLNALGISFCILPSSFCIYLYSALASGLPGRRSLQPAMTMS